jgi:Mrp family chromosome partitioning ATPase
MKAPNTEVSRGDGRASERFASRPVRSAERLNGKQRQALTDLQRTWQRLALQVVRGSGKGKAATAPQAIGVTSAIHGEGRTTAAIGLASALALETGERVALLEVDWEHPTLAADFQTDPLPGIVDYAQGRCDWEDIFRKTALDNLAFAPIGGRQHHRKAAAASVDATPGLLRQSMPAILRQLKEEFHYIVLDLPPVLSNSLHTEGVIRALDGSLLVVRAGVTPLRQVRDALQWIGEERLKGIIHVGPPSAVPRWVSELLLG